MGANAIFIAALILFDGLAVAWAAWELWKLRPGKMDDAEAHSSFSRALLKAGSMEPASPETAGHPEREHGPDHR